MFVQVYRHLRLSYLVQAAADYKFPITSTATYGAQSVSYGSGSLLKKKNAGLASSPFSITNFESSPQDECAL